MAEEKQTRRQYLTLQALDPVTGKLTAEVQVSHERMQAVGRRSLGHARECGYVVPATLQRPTAIFEGLRRDEDEDLRGVGWRCYCGIPDHSYQRDGTQAAPYPNQVYLVFVNEERVAYNWRWEKADPDKPTLPVGYLDRFKKQVL
jgi:hypothetical protein